MARRQRDAEHQRDAHGQCHRDLEGADAVGQRQCVVALNEIVGRVVDACTRHQREDARQQKYRDRGLVETLKIALALALGIALVCSLPLPGREHKK